jgi:hypothetical protein
MANALAWPPEASLSPAQGEQHAVLYLFLTLVNTNIIIAALFKEQAAPLTASVIPPNRDHKSRAYSRRVYLVTRLGLNLFGHRAVVHAWLKGFLIRRFRVPATPSSSVRTNSPAGFRAVKLGIRLSSPTPNRLLQLD